MANRKSTIGIVVHHTVTPQNYSPDSLRAIFKARFGVNYIGYNFYINGDGKVYSDIGADGFGIHNNVGRLQNYNSVGIALAGNFEHQKPTQAQLNSLSNLIKDLMAKYNISKSNIVGHKDMKATACPGKNLYALKPWIINNPVSKEGDVMWWEKLPNNNTIWAYNNFKGVITAVPYSGTGAWDKFEKDGGSMAKVKIVNQLTETTIQKETKALNTEIGKLKINLSDLQTKYDKLDEKLNDTIDGYETQISILKKTHIDEMKKQKAKYEKKILELKESTGRLTLWEKFIRWILGK